VERQRGIFSNQVELLSVKLTDLPCSTHSALLYGLRGIIMEWNQQTSQETDAKYQMRRVDSYHEDSAAREKAEIKSLARMELESHADTCYVGKVAEIVAYTGKYCDVSGFSNSLNQLSHIPIVTGAVAVDLPQGRVMMDAS
jgi:hypothetical protein